MDDPRTRPLRWALIGCGNVGKWHAGSAVSTPDVEVRAFCDINTDAASSYCEQFQGYYYTTDPMQIFSDPDVDIVAIATPHGSHADLAVAALDAGKHLYLEKPMAMTTADCLRINAAMQAAGTKLMMNFTIRFSGATRAIKKRLRPPKVSHAQCMVSDYYLSDALDRWYWDPALGGGPLYDVGVHMVDLLCWMHGAPPIEVFATGGQVTHPGAATTPGVTDTAAATIRFANNSVATLLMSDAGSNDVLSKWFFQFFDGKHSAVLHDHFKKVTFTGPEANTDELRTETIAPPPIERLPLLVAAIRHDTDPYVPATAGIIATLVVEQIAQSIHTGQPRKIELPSELRA